jgi:hypothetical protein
LSIVALPDGAPDMRGDGTSSCGGYRPRYARLTRLAGRCEAPLLEPFQEHVQRAVEHAGEIVRGQRRPE